MPDRKAHLTREEILSGLGRINDFLRDRNVQGEICLYGGACLCLAFAARNATKDVDAAFEPTSLIRKAAMEVAAERGWHWNWLNDDVKGFLSRRGSDGLELLASCEFSHLTVYAARAEYLLAMKCLAARMSESESVEFAEESSDLEDAVWLCHKLGITGQQRIMENVVAYYPDAPLPERTEIFIDEIMNHINAAT